MIRFLMPLILIGVAVSGFFVFTSPLYNEVSALKSEVASYDEALKNSKALENERDKLVAKFNLINPEDLAKLQKLLPDNIDNIRLILEIEKIASPYGMALKDVKYSTIDKDTKPNTSVTVPGIQGGGEAPESKKDYGVWNLEFSVSGKYADFINFNRDLESNLRIVDIDSVTFSSDGDAKSNPLQVYKYNFKIKTYWLKN